MKKITIVVLALAMAFAIVPAAMATSCSATAVITSGSTTCTDGSFSFSWAAPGTGISQANGTTGFNSFKTSGSGTNVTLGFQVTATYPVDIDQVYQVTGPAGSYVFDNGFTGGSGSISEVICADAACDDVLYSMALNTSGVEEYSPSISVGSTFYIDKDVTDAGFSEFNDSIDVAPEPSSLVLLGTGLAGAAFLLFRRNRTARAGSVA